MRRAIFVTIAAAVVTGWVVNAAPRPFTIQDLIAMDRLSEPATSPLHGLVAFTVSSLDREASRRRTDIWVVDADAGAPARLTSDPAGDTSPVWSADGKSVWFLSSRSGSSQVWRATLAGPPGAGGGDLKAETVQVTKLPLDVGAFRVSPDQSHLAVALDVFVDCDSLACTTTRLEQKTKTKATGQIYDRLFIRHWDTWKDGRRSHLFVVPAGGGGRAGRRDARHGRRRAVQAVRRRRGVHLHAGRQVASSSPRATRAAKRPGPPTSICSSRRSTALASRATSQPATRRPTPRPSFSPDGRTLAYLAMARAGLRGGSAAASC